MTRYMNKHARYSALAGGIGAGVGGAIGAASGKNRKERIQRGLGGAAIGALAGLRGKKAPVKNNFKKDLGRGIAAVGIVGALANRARRLGKAKGALVPLRRQPSTAIQRAQAKATGTALAPQSRAVVPRRSGGPKPPPPRGGGGGPKPGGPKPTGGSGGSAAGFTPYDPKIHGEGQKAFKAHYRNQARKVHPDRGGTTAAFQNMKDKMQAAAQQYGYKLASDEQMLELLQMISDGHLGTQAQQAYHAIKEAQAEAEYAEWNKVASDPWNSYASPLFEDAEESRHHRLNTLLRRY